MRASKAIEHPGTVPKTRVAILSDAASQQFVPLLRTLFYENGVNAEIYEGAFDAIELEAYDSASPLYEFRPDLVVLANCTQALRARYYQQGGEEFLETATSRMLQVWDALQTNSPARLIQCNYPLPYERPFGNFDLKVPQSLHATVTALNGRIAQCAQERRNVLVCDVEAIASWVGRAQWFDDRLWNMTKAFCQLEHLPRVAQALVEMVLSTMGSPW